MPCTDIAYCDGTRGQPPVGPHSMDGSTPLRTSYVLCGTRIYICYGCYQVTTDPKRSLAHGVRDAVLRRHFKVRPSVYHPTLLRLLWY